MAGETITVRSSRLVFKILVCLGAVFLAVSVWLGYLLANDTADLYPFLIVLFIGLGCLAFAVGNSGTYLTYAKGKLSMTKPFGRREGVELTKLVKAERYDVVGNPGYQVLKLTDNSGSIIIVPSIFDLKDIEFLADLLSPYIFIPTVDKNFMDLKFSDEQGLNIPRKSIARILAGTFLYFMLPCALITLGIVVWAIATNQPAFR